MADAQCGSMCAKKPLCVVQTNLFLYICSRIPKHSVMINASERIAIIAGEMQITYTQMLQHISAFAANAPKEKGNKCLIFSENRVGWIYALYATWLNGGVAVPVDAGSTVQDVAYIMADCRPEAVWVTAERRPVAEAAIAESGVPVRLMSIEEAENAPIEGLTPASIEYADGDIALICYTSGTTGSPKGVMLSFENVMANVRAVWKEVPIFNEARRCLVLLPLHHVLPLVGTAVIPFIAGGGVAICPSLAAADIMETLQRGRIGIMIGVPRLWQTLYRGIKAKIDASALTRALYGICDKVGSRTLSRLVFTSVRKKMGGAITYCVSGGAALDGDTARGLKTLGLDVLEGYGMTEAAPMITFTRPGDIRPGCVGLPVPSVKVKLVDGELCASGRNVMLGYYNRPEETAAIIDAEGWLHTGDLATIDDAGRVTITGRKKEIIVLSNGKNVNPADIEEKIEHYADVVKECAVTEHEDMLCLIVVPQPAWAVGKTDEEMESIIKTDILQPYNAGVATYKKVMSMRLYHGELPRTRLDKLQRFRLKDLLTATETAAPAQEEEDTYSDNPVFAILATYIAGEKHVRVKPADNLETDLAMDSLDMVALQGFVEQTFGVRMSTKELMAFSSVEALTQYLEEHKTREEVEDMDWHKILCDDDVRMQKLPKMGCAGRLIMGCCRLLVRPLFRPEVKGQEHIPTEGAFILAPNHQSYVDGPLVMLGLTRPVRHNTFFYAKKDHVANPVSRYVASRSNIIVMDMNTLSDSIRQLGQVLRMNKALVIFPEGTRTRTGQVGTFKNAFAILARELDVPVVPVRISGAYEAWPRTNLLPRPHRIKVEYLEPVRVMPEEDNAAFSERIRTIIAEGL